MIVKCGRNEIELTNEDLIMFNGVCYQVTTKQVGSGWSTSVPIIAKNKAQKMIKDGLLKEVKRSNSEMIKGELIYYSLT